MNRKRRYTLALCTASLVLLWGNAHADSANYPTKTIRIVSPFAPGGATDVLARLIAQKLGEAWKQNVIVENQPGGGGVIATGAVTRAEKDGHTLLLGTAGGIEVLPSLMKKVPYDPEKDLAPAGMLVIVENVLVVNEKLPVRTLAELVAYARRNPGKLHYGSSGIGTTGHLAGEVFKQQAGIDIVHVPYRGGAPAATALLGGEIEMIFSTVPSAVGHIKAGKMRPLGVTGEKPIATLPEVAPIRDQGLPNYRIKTWYGLFAPAGTSQDVVNKIHGELGRILAMPDVKTKLLEQGWLPYHIPLAQVSQQIHTGIREWKVVTERAGIRPE